MSAPVGLFELDGNKPEAHGYGINSDSPLATGLVGYWPFWEGTGIKAGDVASAADATLDSDLLWLDNGIQFNASSGLDRDAGTYPEVGGDMSIVVNLSIGNTGADRYYLHYGSTGSASGNFAIKVSRVNGTVTFRDCPTGGSFADQVLTFSSVFETFRRYQIVITRTLAGSIVAYRDGGDVQTTTGQSGLLSGAQAIKPLAIGHSALCAAFLGNINQLSVWTRILSGSEVQSLHTNPYQLITPPSYIPIVASEAPAGFAGSSHILGGGILSC